MRIEVFLEKEQESAQVTAKVLFRAMEEMLCSVPYEKNDHRPKWLRLFDAIAYSLNHILLCAAIVGNDFLFRFLEMLINNMESFRRIAV